MSSTVEQSGFDKTLLPADSAEGANNLEAARAIRQSVQARLRFDEFYWKRPGKPKIEDLFAPKGTYCVGYALLNSQELKSAGVDHLVGVVNTHATLVLPATREDGSKTLWLLDPLSSIDHDLADAVDLSTVPLDLANQAAQNSERVSMILDGGRIGTERGPTLEARADKSPWLIRGNSAGRRNSTRLVLSLFEPEQGREILTNYAHFLEATRDDDLELASTSLINMPGQFPDIDISGKAPRHARTVVRQLVLAGEQERAVQVTGAFFDSFAPVDEDTRVSEYRADCMRYIATVGNQSDGFSGVINLKYRQMHEQARSIYQSLMDNPRYCKSSVPGKLATAQTMYEND